MREIVLQEPGSLTFREGDDIPPLQSGDALVRIHRIGVCGTDIHAFHGRQPFFSYPRVLGHELGVELLSSADGSIAPGTPCAVEPYLNNPDSPASRLGKTNCCENLQVLGVHTDGGHRRLLVVPESKLHPGEDLTFEQLALVETLCIGAHAVERAALREPDYCAVIGAGPIGLGCAAFAQIHTGNLALIDVSKERLANAPRMLDFPRAPSKHLVNPVDGAVAEQLQDAFNGQLPTVIFDATGNAKSMESCVELAAHGARIIFVGLFQGSFSVDDPTFHRKELSILSSRNAPGETFTSVIDAIGACRIDPKVWISHRMKFEDVPDQFSEVTRAPDLVKAVIEID